MENPSDRHLHEEHFLRMRRIFADRRTSVPDCNTAVPPDSLKVTYQVRIVGNKETVVDLNSGFEIPMALRRDFISTADGNFPELFERLVSKPLATAVSGFLSSRFEELNQPVPGEQPAKPHLTTRHEWEGPASLQEAIKLQNLPKPKVQ